MELRDSNSQQQQQQDSSGPSSSVTALIQNITSNMSVFGYNDEYDPLRPNDYEKLKEQHRRERELENQKREEDELKGGLYDDDDYENEEKEISERPIRKGNVFAPPPSLIEEDKRASSNNQDESGIFIYEFIEKIFVFHIDIKDEYSTTSPFNADEDMETESAGLSLGFGSTKGYLE